jgi:hypothetical protein
MTTIVIALVEEEVILEIHARCGDNSGKGSTQAEGVDAHSVLRGV